ncbi:hypothetical protein CCP4SC76_7070002 [Gammaproteobacteria bacterium]
MSAISLPLVGNTEAGYYGSASDVQPFGRINPTPLPTRTPSKKPPLVKIGRRFFVVDAGNAVNEYNNKKPLNNLLKPLYIHINMGYNCACFECINSELRVEAS